MRIISGEYGGRVLEAPAGMRTRPTTARVREAIFSSLESMFGSLDSLRVLDAFAGSGLMGFEALSRGCSHVTFVESDKAAVSNLKNNCKKLQITSDKFKLINNDVFKCIDILEDLKDLVFIDPPYIMEPIQVFNFISSLSKKAKLSDKFIAVYEYSQANASQTLQAMQSSDFRIIKNKKYGHSCVLYIERA